MMSSRDSEQKESWARRMRDLLEQPIIDELRFRDHDCWLSEDHNSFLMIFTFFINFQDILSQSIVALHIEVRPRLLVPDTNCFVDDLISIQAIAIAHPLYQLMIPITGKGLETNSMTNKWLLSWASIVDLARCQVEFAFELSFRFMELLIACKGGSFAWSYHPKNPMSLHSSFLWFRRSCAGSVATVKLQQNACMFKLMDRDDSLHD